VTVRIELHGKGRKDLDVEIEPGTTVLGLLKTISVRPEAVVTFRKDSPVPLDALVNDGDILIFIEAASGGS
jgi:sulfur carrier protein ThiS